MVYLYVCMFCMFLHVCHKSFFKMIDLSQPRPMHMCVCLHVFEEYGTIKLNRALRILYSSDLWLENLIALDVADCLFQFLRAYKKLAKIHWDAFEARFALLPKLHFIHEIEHELRRQARVASWVLNPICETCSMDEDFVGRCAYLTRCVDARTCALRSIQRYLAQLSIRWA